MKTCLEEQEDQVKNINFPGQSLDQVDVENYQLALFGPKEPPDKHPHMSFVIHSDSAIFPKQENSSKDKNNGILTQLSATQRIIIKSNSIFILKLRFNSNIPFLIIKVEPFIPYLIKPSSGTEKNLVVLHTAPKYYNGTRLNYQHTEFIETPIFIGRCKRTTGKKQAHLFLWESHTTIFNSLFFLTKHH